MEQMNNTSYFMRSFVGSLRGKLLENESLSHYNTWRVGGPAKYIYFPADVEDLVNFLSGVPATEKILWLGLGSNTLVRDAGFEGTVIITQGCLKKIQYLEETSEIRAEAGVSCAQVARFAARLGMEGAEFLAGVPGTIGGALKMNAGCYGHETWQFVQRVEVINREGQIIRKFPQAFEITYRSVKHEHNQWFIASYFKFNPGNKDVALSKVRELLDRRAATQPTGDATCGSVFRNPHGDYSARLIENLGLKGFAIGGAYVSPKHANFIVNGGHSTAQNIEDLMAYIIKKVESHYGIRLIPEVHIVGDKLNNGC